MRRRVLRSHHTTGLVNEALGCLNEMFCGYDVGEVAGQRSAAQESAVAMVARAAQRLGKPPECMSGQGALRELLSRRGYADEPVALAPIKLDLLSLPPVDRRLVALGSGCGRCRRTHA